MQVEIIYDHGRLEFVHPIKLKRDHLRLVVNVPDEEVEAGVATDNPYGLSPEVLQAAAQTRQRLNAILHAPLPPDNELPELSPKYQERMAAMELRAELRKEQGRPV